MKQFKVLLLYGRCWILLDLTSETHFKFLLYFCVCHTCICLYMRWHCQSQTNINSLVQSCLRGGGMLQWSRWPWILLFLSVFCPFGSAQCMLMLSLFANMIQLICSCLCWLCCFCLSDRLSSLRLPSQATRPPTTEQEVSHSTRYSERHMNVFGKTRASVFSRSRYVCAPKCILTWSPNLGQIKIFLIID